MTATDEEMQKIALQGVNVEVDDEDETDGLFFGEAYPAPALSDVYDEEESGASLAGLGRESFPAMDEDSVEDSIECRLLKKSLILP